VLDAVGFGCGFGAGLWGAGEGGGEASSEAGGGETAALFFPADLVRFAARVAVSLPLSVFSRRGRFREGSGAFSSLAGAGELGGAGLWLRPLMVALGVKKLVREACFFAGGFDGPAMVGSMVDGGSQKMRDVTPKIEWSAVDALQSVARIGDADRTRHAIEWLQPSANSRDVERGARVEGVCPCVPPFFFCFPDSDPNPIIQSAERAKSNLIPALPRHRTAHFGPFIRC
jgi:hypothetical protein